MSNTVSPNTTIHVINTWAAWLELRTNLQTNKLWAFDTETCGNFISGKILMMQFCWKAGEAWVLPFYRTPCMTTVWTVEESYGIMCDLGAILSDEQYKKIGQNIKYDYKFLKQYDIELKGVVFDTLLASYLLNENNPQSHALDKLALKYTNMGDYSSVLYAKLGVTPNKIDENTYSTVPWDVLVEYAGKDADATFRVFKVLYPRIEKQGLKSLLTQVLVPASLAFGDIECNGICVDLNHYKMLEEKYTKELKQIEAELCDFPEVKTLPIRLKQLKETKEAQKAQQDPKYKPKKINTQEVNFNSNDHLRVLFFDMLGLPAIKMTKNKKKKTNAPPKMSTDASVLEKLADHHEIPRLIHKHRIVSKFLSTYVRPMEENLMEDGRVHSNYTLFITRTGRSSSVSPNLQNFPTRDPDKAKELRQGIIAPPGYKMVEADYAQIEFRLLISEAMDDQGIKDILDGVDIHKTTAAIAYEIDISEVTKTQRDASKTINYAIAYGKDIKNLAKELDIDLELAQKLFNAVYKRYPKIKLWMQRMEQKALGGADIKNWIGRRRRLQYLLKGIREAYGYRKEVLIAELKRLAVNSPIQGGASDIVLIGMIRVARLLKGYRSKIVNEVHDSLWFYIADEEFDELIPKIKQEMERSVSDKIKVPMSVDVKVGHCLGDMVSLKEYYESSGIKNNGGFT